MALDLDLNLINDVVILEQLELPIIGTPQPVIYSYTPEGFDISLIYHDISNMTVVQSALIENTYVDSPVLHMFVAPSIKASCSSLFHAAQIETLKKLDDTTYFFKFLPYIKSMQQYMTRVSLPRMVQQLYLLARLINRCRNKITNDVLFSIFMKPRLPIMIPDRSVQFNASYQAALSLHRKLLENKKLSHKDIVELAKLHSKNGVLSRRKRAIENNISKKLIEKQENKTMNKVMYDNSSHWPDEPFNELFKNTSKVFSFDILNETFCKKIHFIQLK